MESFFLSVHWRVFPTVPHNSAEHPSTYWSLAQLPVGMQLARPLTCTSCMVV